MPLEKDNVAEHGSRRPRPVDGGVADAIAEQPLDEDPDAGLELREEISDELKASQEAVARGGATRSAEQVAERLGLTW